MAAGLPGLGLGGLFFVLSALLAPVVELYRTAQGRSSAGAWRQVGRQFAIALVMVAIVGSVVPLAPLGITTALLATVLVAAKAAQLGLRFANHRAARPRTRGAICRQPCTCCTEART
ncbi:MAG: hypothetical protein QOI10_3079 [Solirubrobacterales bacterium]|jgi:hypothetical protein|nr:hypothetical protein [Solirubrobacterales bacterium]